MLKKQINLAVLFTIAIVLSVYANPVWADGLSAEDSLPTEHAIDAPPPPLLQAEQLIPPPLEEVESGEDLAPATESDLWRMISEGMILLKSEADGEIVASEEPKQLLGVHDIVYLHSNHEPFSPEEELVVYRISRPVLHPTTGSFLGDLVQILGVVKVQNVGEDVSTAKIVLSKDTISRQDKIASINHFILPPAEQIISPEEGLEAMIVEAPENHVNQAQHDIVYIDHGRDEGVSPGDQFVVIHGGERQGAFSKSDSSQEGLRLPYREIGTMVVLATQEHTSTAKITSSLETISKGDAILYIDEE